MEDILPKHRKQQKDLQSRITQKKKSATKKTRKGVNEECTLLERQLKEQQASELNDLDGETKALRNEQDASFLEEERQPGSLKDDDTSGVAQSLQSVSLSTPFTENGAVKKPSRQKARLARRAAEQEAATKQAESEAADLPNLREKEAQSMREAYVAKGLVEHEIRSDGHCLYAAFADQLKDANIDLKPLVELHIRSTDKYDYTLIRRVAAAYIEKNSEDFMPFLEEPFGEYVAKMRDTGEWGGHLEILALSKAYEVDIHILHGNGQVDKIESGSQRQEQPLWLAYYRHSHGLGEHYNSLRRQR